MYCKKVRLDCTKIQRIFLNFIWNLYDFSSEIRREGGISCRNTKGIITMDRKDKKDAFYYYKAQWSKEPFVKIAQERFVNRITPAVIKVYSNQEKVTLTAGGRTYEICSRDGVFRFEGIVLEILVYRYGRGGEDVSQGTDVNS